MLVTHPGGQVAVTQPAHARMCGQLARAWGNERFGEIAPADALYLAVEQHEIGMTEWDRAPTLDPATGLPTTVTRMDLATHLPLRLEGPRRLVAQDPYAALVTSMHHTAFYSRPRTIGLLRRPGRQIRSYLARSAAFQAELRASVDASDEELERNRRLVRTWDGLSHDLLLGRAPCGRASVPTANGALVDLSLARRGGAYTLDPWPFASERVSAGAVGRLLEGTFTDAKRLHAALAAAPSVELTYELVPA